MLKNKKSYKLTPHAQKFNGVQGLFKSNKKNDLPLNQSKHRKLIRFAKGVRNVFIVLTTGIVLVVTANTIKANILNSKVPVKGNNFESSEVFDNNGNDVEFDNNGSIIEDDTTKEEMQLMESKIMKKLLQDAKRGNVQKIDDVISATLLPFNLNEENNEYDKYMYTIFFKSNGENYLLSYLTGNAFESEAMSKKDYLGDFLSYLKKCAIYDCAAMDNNQKEIATLAGVDYVGNYYVGYDQSDREFYYIPVFKNGLTKIYSVMCNILDGQGLDPMQTLHDQLAGKIEKVFELQDVLELNSDLYSSTWSLAEL